MRACRFVACVSMLLLIGCTQGFEASSQFGNYGSLSSGTGGSGSGGGGGGGGSGGGGTGTLSCWGGTTIEITGLVSPHKKVRAVFQEKNMMGPSNTLVEDECARGAEFYVRGSTSVLVHFIEIGGEPPDSFDLTVTTCDDGIVILDKTDVVTNPNMNSLGCVISSHAFPANPP